MSTINPEKLIFLRKEAGLTAEALADAAHVGRATITRIENGKAGATRTETVKRLASTLKCQPADLFKPPEPDQARSLFDDRAPLDLSISTAAQNALELVAISSGAFKRCSAMATSRPQSMFGRFGGAPPTT